MRRGDQLVRTLNQLGPFRTAVGFLALAMSALWLFAALAFGVAPVKAPLVNRLGGVAAGDFMFFYPAAVLSGAGQADRVYEIAPMTAIARTQLRPETAELVWPYPPTMSLALAPLGVLSPKTALWTWLSLMSVAMIAVGRMTLGSWALAPLVLLFPGSAFALFTGQVSPLLALCMATLTLRILDRPTFAGIGLGLFVLKPQLAAVPGIFLLIQRRWVAISTALVAGSAIVAASLVVLGTKPWTAFFSTVIRHAQVLDVEAPMTRFVSPMGMFRTLGLGLGLSLFAHVLVAIPLLVLSWRLWTTGARRSHRAMGLAAGAMLGSPYALDYDLLLLLVPWCLLMVESLEAPVEAPVEFGLWLLLTAMLPVLYLTGLYAGWSLGALALTAALMLSWRCDRRLAAG